MERSRSAALLMEDAPTSPSKPFYLQKTFLIRVLLAILIILSPFCLGMYMGYRQAVGDLESKQVSKRKQITPKVSTPSLPRLIWNPVAADGIERSDFVRQMAKTAWNTFLNQSALDLSPKARKPPITLSWEEVHIITASLSTFQLMDLKSEYDSAFSFVEKLMRGNDSLELPGRYDNSTSETTANTPGAVIGALLSSYALTGEEMLRDLALKVEKQYRPGLANYDFNPVSEKYLHDLMPDGEEKSINNNLYPIKQLVWDSKRFLKWLELEKKPTTKSDKMTNKNWENHAQLLQLFIQSGWHNVEHLYTLLDSMSRIQWTIGPLNRFNSSMYSGFRANEEPERLWFVYGQDGTPNPPETLYYPTCEVAGLLRLTADAVRMRKLSAASEINSRVSMLHRKPSLTMDLNALARGFGETCRVVTNETEWGLLPFTFKWNIKTGKIDTQRHKQMDADLAHYKLETAIHLASSYFYLNYRYEAEDWLDYSDNFRTAAWQLANDINALMKFIKNPLRNTKNTRIPANLIGGTLKFLYLTFKDDNLPWGRQWFLTNDGQPLPICGHNQEYLTCSRYI